MIAIPFGTALRKGPRALKTCSGGPNVGSRINRGNMRNLASIKVAIEISVRYTVRTIEKRKKYFKDASFLNAICATKYIVNGIINLSAIRLHVWILNCTLNASQIAQQIMANMGIIIDCLNGNRS
jgi:hypothetical protein